MEKLDVEDRTICTKIEQKDLDYYNSVPRYPRAQSILDYVPDLKEAEIVAHINDERVFLICFLKPCPPSDVAV